MAFNIKNLKRWYLMLTGQSVWHVNQDIGKCFSADTIKGYYNNMTEKVTKMPELLDSEDLPLLETEGKKVEMPVAIFQYGLGAYDLYLQTKDEKYKKKFNQAVKWAEDHLDEKGRWNNFFYVYPDNPYGAMAQGEGVSLLLRAFVQTQDEKYLAMAKSAIDFMLKPVSEGGTALYEDNDLKLAEYTHRPIVMNGWIFAWWGLFDYVLATNDAGVYKKAQDTTCKTLVKCLPQFKTWYWSKYDLGGRMASPFYHNLHVAQMQAMHQLTGHEIFRDYANRWEKQQNNQICKAMAFVKKAVQKIRE